MSILTENAQMTSWDGGECPLEPETTVIVKTRQGKLSEETPAWLLSLGYNWWRHEDPDHGFDIIAYRVVQS